MVAIDIYFNETTRHGNIILPPTSALEHDHDDRAFLHMAVRNTFKFNEAVFAPLAGVLHEWEIFNGLEVLFTIFLNLEQ
jgi:anaerobic selenocysteine-containing dehydrogenase